MSVYKVKPNSLAAGTKQDQLAAVALGSAVAVCLYDETTKVGGLIHTLFSGSCDTKTERPYDALKYVESALDVLLDRLESMGYNKESGWAKLIGGARIFSFASESASEDVGKKNIEAAKNWLKEHDVPIKAEDTGDNFGRSVRFHLADGSVEVETVNQYSYNI